MNCKTVSDALVRLSDFALCGTLIDVVANDSFRVNESSSADAFLELIA